LSENTASQEGGAIYYNYNRPKMVNLTTLGNKAPYGANIASYAVKIRMNGTNTDAMTIDNVGSGIAYNDTLVFSLLDYDNQVMVLENDDQILINPVNRTEASIMGTSYALLRNGTASFTSLVASAKPGMNNVIFQASSKAIDSTKIKNVFGAALSNNSIKMNFRYCKPGEIQLDSNTCTVCSAGTYSLDWNATSCSECLSGTVCPGGEAIAVNPGYWRRTTNSTTIVE
jgi:hypothetical protein